MRLRPECVVEGTIDDRGVKAETFERIGDNPGLALVDVGVGDEKLGGGVPGDHPVVVDQTGPNSGWCGVGKHADHPGVGLAQVPKTEQPEGGGEVLQVRADRLGGPPVQVGTPKRNTDITTAGHRVAQFPLEHLGDAERGGHDPGRADPAAGPT